MPELEIKKRPHNTRQTRMEGEAGPTDKESSLTGS